MGSFLLTFTFLAQTPQYNFFEPADNQNVLIGFIIFLIVIIILVIVNRIRSGGGKTGNNTKKKFSKRTFKQAAKSTGLADTHIETLLNIIENYKLKNPFLLLQNGPSLDSALGKAMNAIDYSSAREEVKEAQKLTLFHIKQIIELHSQKGGGIANTRQLRVGQDLLLVSESKRRYDSRVSSNQNNVLLVRPPTDKTGHMVKMKKWTPLTVFFWKKSGEGYNFSSKVVGYRNIQGKFALMIQHSNKVQLAQQRRYRRKELNKSAYFFNVHIAQYGVGKKKEKRAIISERSALGQIQDISSGGCAIRTTSPLKQGALLKIQFEVGRRKPVIAFGKLVGLEKNSSAGTIMHVKFTKVTRKNINKINAYVYNINMKAAI